VLGSAPFSLPDGTLRNRAPVIVEGRELFQDKLFLTPWETALARGDTVQLWKLKGATFCVLVCLDIEVPELSAALRGKGVDCILVPSATESVLGVERVNRCASARAVELGCAVGVCPLVGRARSELVDENKGVLGWYLPSQGPFRVVDREGRSECHEGGFHTRRTSLPLSDLRTARAQGGETNPALVVETSFLSQHIRGAQ
jgi:predicted amidohydrolase